jgi:hypothetical protein
VGRASLQPGEHELETLDRLRKDANAQRRLAITVLPEDPSHGLAKTVSRATSIRLGWRSSSFIKP